MWLAVIPQNTEYLLPLQVGVQVPSAAETMARTIDLWSGETDNGDFVLQVDMKNAFSSLDRQAMLHEILKRAPRLYPYASSR